MINNLSLEQLSIIDSISNGDNVFVTGSAGTGKSFLLKNIKHKFSNSGFHVTASTGIAAVHIGGVTIHSWAGIGFGNAPIQQIINYIKSNKATHLRRKLKSARILAIDEISMVSDQIFDILDTVLREIRLNSQAFGGLQIIVLGDFLQLPPVNRENQKFCFESQAWKTANFKIYNLNKSFRQLDEDFCNLLKRMRFAQLSEEDIDILRLRMIARDDGEIKPTIIVTHNKQVELINESELNKLKFPPVIYNLEGEGSDKDLEFLVKNCLAPQKLVLKKNAQVMMLKNTHHKDGIINGSLGVIIEFSEENLPIVKFHNGVIKQIEHEQWVIEEYDSDSEMMVTKAVITQIPLVLSWAITVHKSQGMSLDKIECDLGSAFVEGQVYVAISRVKSIEGLYLKRFNSNHVKANSKVIDFYNSIESVL